MSDQRVAITGAGIVSPLGDNPGSFFRSLLAGTSAIGLLDVEFIELLGCKIAAQLHFDAERHFKPSQWNSLDRATQIALVAARRAFQDAGLEGVELDPRRSGVAVGTGMAGIHTVGAACKSIHRDLDMRLSPVTVLMGMTNAAASHIAQERGFAGPNLTYSTACSSSTAAIGEASRMIRRGDVDFMIAGGTEALLTLEAIKAWEATRTLARMDVGDPSRSCKPFSANRTGMVLGEGAAMVVLESMTQARERGAKILAEVAGYFTGNDVGHLSQPSLSGQSAAMAGCLQDAGLAPEEIGYIHAHGTGTAWNDRTETAAIKRVFGQEAYRIPVSSTKSMHGHLLGASGAVEVVACIQSLQSRSIAPTINLTEPDPECDLDYVPNEGRSMTGLRYVMKNSFAFGGTSACLIFGRSPE
jgi:3-oxoacyl-[acyl-carrier-protein] synthase II